MFLFTMKKVVYHWPKEKPNKRTVNYMEFFFQTIRSLRNGDDDDCDNVKKALSVSGHRDHGASRVPLNNCLDGI